MHTVEMLEQALSVAKQLGYSVRFESLAGHSGACEIKGKKILFLDLELSPGEQLEHVLDALKHEPLHNAILPEQMQRLFTSSS